MSEQLKKFEAKLAAEGVFTYPLDIPIDDGNAQRLGHVLWALERATENDYCCGRDDCTAENPQCSHMELVAAKNELLKITEPVHRSLNPERLSNPPEDIFLRRWQKENERSPGLNYGYGVLQLLLTPTRIRNDGLFSCPGAPYYVPPVSQRDAEVAATVIQWLGTSGGRCFMEAAEREIAQAQAERRAMEQEAHDNIFRKSRILPFHDNLARRAAMEFCRADDPKFKKLVSQIVAAIQTATAKSQDTAGAT